jgi:protein required for attachment to host cells
MKRKNVLETTWVLVANGERARCLERHAAKHSLTELADFVHPHASLAGKAGGGDLTGEAGKGHGRTGHAATQFEPRTELHAKERATFARELSDHLNEAAAEHQYQKILLIATSPMLGEIKPLLNSAANKALGACVAIDLTRYKGADLEERVNKALQYPG